MVRIYGMCDKIGNVSFPPSDNGQAEFDKPFSDSLAQIMDEEAKKIVDEAYLRTKKLLLERSDELVSSSSSSRSSSSSFFFQNKLI